MRVKKSLKVDFEMPATEKDLLLYVDRILKNGYKYCGFREGKIDGINVREVKFVSEKNVLILNVNWEEENKFYFSKTIKRN